jgi:hypothetical protein
VAAGFGVAPPAAVLTNRLDQYDHRLLPTILRADGLLARRVVSLCCDGKGV